MRIAIIGAQNTGKTFLADSIVKKFKGFKKPDKTYRDIIKEKKLLINKEGTLESQLSILEALCEQAQLYAKDKNIVHDRCVIDNLVYTMYLVENGKIEESFLADTLKVVRNAVRLYDIILYLPLEKNKHDIDGSKKYTSKDIAYQESIGEFFEAVVQSYRDSDGVVFPLDDSPAVIEVWGDETKGEKTKMIEDYIDPESGELVETEKSVMEEMQELVKEIIPDKFKD